MIPAFAEIAFTDSVKAAQRRYGNGEGYSGLEGGGDRRDLLTEYEMAFLAERDSFYMASVGENGWPYVQHRGGPKGFIKVLDDKTIGFADFKGNRQYISVGNLNADDRVTLFIMDYPNRRRLKLWARARVVDVSTDGELVAKLAVPGYRARVERGIVLTIEALDWNCPQHITPRFSAEEVRGMITPLFEENRKLKQELAQVTAPID
jgi:hypothetical protein